MAPDYSDYLGCLINVISRSEFRYEGVLYSVDLKSSVIVLKNVRCYGTEGRPRNGPEIPPKPNVIESFMFQGSEINKVIIKSWPLPKIGKQIHEDHAVNQAYDSRVLISPSPPSPLVGQHGTLTVPIQCQDTIGRPFRDSHSSLMQNTIGSPSLTIPTHEPNHIEIPFRNSLSLQMQNTIRRPSLTIPAHEPNHNETSPTISHSSKYLAPHPNLPPDIGSKQYPASQVSSPSAHTTVMTSISSLPLVMPETGDNKAQITGQSVPNTASSFEDSTSGPPLTLPPSSLSPNQLSESGANVPSTLRLCDDPRDLVTPTHLPELTGPLEHQAPLLPSTRETPTQQLTEDFDIQAMNEKFKEDELKSEQGNLLEVVEENKEKESYMDKLLSKLEPADIARGSGTGRDLFCKPKKSHTKTTRNLQQTGSPDIAGDGVGRGSNNQGSNNQGAGDERILK